MKLNLQKYFSLWRKDFDFETVIKYYSHLSDDKQAQVHECYHSNRNECNNTVTIVSFQVITIFSASNYYETGSNKGSYMKLVGPQLSTHFVQFNTASSKAGAKTLTFRQKIGLVEQSAIRELSTKIMAHKDKLVEEFTRKDPSQTGIQILLLKIIRID